MMEYIKPKMELMDMEEEDIVCVSVDIVGDGEESDFEDWLGDW